MLSLLRFDTLKTGGGENAEAAELRLAWCSGDFFFDRTGFDGDAEAGKSVPGRSGGHLFVDTDSHDNEKTTGAVDDAARVQVQERRSLSDGTRSTVRGDGNILDDA